MPPCAAILRVHPDFRDDIMTQCAKCLAGGYGDHGDCLARLIIALSGDAPPADGQPSST